MLRAVPWSLVGLIFGTVAGFAYGRGVRENANSAVTTSYDSGVATVSLDTGELLRGGLPDILRRIR